MSHNLPPLGSPARDAFEVADLVAVSTGERPVHCNILELRRLARETLSASPAARRVFFLRANPTNDKLELVSFGRRGAWKREWVFGPITRATRLI